MSYQKTTITVFTPTYNRADLLYNLYSSLKLQTYKNFDWLIVDDGSTDKTRDVVESFKKENILNITYIKTKNKGKMQAINTGVNNCKTDLFFIVDSDDYITESAIEKLITSWTQEKSENLSGIIAMRGNVKTYTPIGGTMLPEIKTETLYNLYNKYSYKGDLAVVYRTDVLKKFPFPYIEGEKFISEAYIWMKIDEHYKMLILRDIIYLCEYLDDGYTTNAKKLMLNNPKGYRLYYLQHARMSQYLSRGLKIKRKIISIIKYIGFSIKAKEPIFRNNPYKILTICLYPIGIAYRSIKLHER
ncbi:glycosyltransferase family 2 protein [Mesobacillus harenae]|uniref:glycosyltransferase family 2 protein n=1 Tax=Mesobacillus harenae TaxID=2213203 RepID=UPI00157FF607|nr:glycosyltransferase family A protein [Mesobacillus harenae]